MLYPHYCRKAVRTAFYPSCRLYKRRNFSLECALVAFKGINAYSEGIFIVIPAPEPVAAAGYYGVERKPVLAARFLKNFSLQGMATLVVRASSKLGSSYASSIMTVCSSGAETPKVSALFLAAADFLCVFDCKKAGSKRGCGCWRHRAAETKTKSAAVRGSLLLQTPFSRSLKVYLSPFFSKLSAAPQTTAPLEFFRSSPS